MAIEAKYVWAHSFTDGLAVVTQNYRQYGFIDRNGEIVIDAQFEHARPFHNGLAAIKLRNKWGYIRAD